MHRYCCCRLKSFASQPPKGMWFVRGKRKRWWTLPYWKCFAKTSVSPCRDSIRFRLTKVESTSSWFTPSSGIASRISVNGMWKNRLFWVSSRSTSSSCGTTSTTMLPNWSKTKSSPASSTERSNGMQSRRRWMPPTWTDSYLRQISYCPSLPIRLSWKQSTRLYTTRLLSCTDLREPESPRKLRIL